MSYGKVFVPECKITTKIMKLISTVLKILFPITILLACVVAIFLSRSLRLQNTDQIKFISQSEKLSSIKEIVNLPTI